MTSLPESKVDRILEPGPRIDCPYVGLIPYSETDARFFFGREREQQIVIANLFASKITILYGASGVGKSSLLRAGVIKELRTRSIGTRKPGDDPALTVIYFNDWKADALDKIKAAITQASGVNSPDDRTVSLRDIIRTVCERTPC